MSPAFDPERVPVRGDLAFCYRLWRPEGGDGETLLLLHGSGVDETTLMPLGGQIAPRATLLAVRGRVCQDGGTRWFTRITPTRFDQDSILAETHAFAAFIAEAIGVNELDLRRTIFVGYSNGANLLSSLMLLHPGLVRQAVLLRAMPVLDHVPDADLSDARVLVIAGAADATYGQFSPALAALLRDHGAIVDSRMIASGHEFGAEDARLTRDWLAGSAVA